MDTEEDIICDSDFLDGINETPTSDAPATVSEVAKFWEEFKLITRTYQETDEVDLIMKVSSKTQIMDYMFHYLCACCAFSASSSTMSTAQLHDHFCLVGSSLVQNMPKQEKHINGIFASLPGSTWPNGFPEYMSMMEAEAPSNSWLKANRCRLACPDKIKKLYFGSRVLKAWTETKRFINNVLNPIFKRVPSSLPSGLQKADVMYWIRVQAWEAEAMERAKAAVRRQFNRAQEGLAEPKKFQLTEHMESVVQKSKEMGFKENWFPECWLVFVFFGLPSARPAVQLSSGMGVPNSATNLEAVMTNSSAVNRRLARELDESPTVRSTDGSTSGPSSKRQRISEVKHVVVVQDNADTQLDRRIKAAESKLELLSKMFPDTHQRVRDAREELLNLYDQVLH
jgi:hypothetical protein